MQTRTDVNPTQVIEYLRGALELTDDQRTISYINAAIVRQQLISNSGHRRRETGK